MAAGCDARQPPTAPAQQLSAATRTSGLDPRGIAAAVETARRLPRLRSLLVLRDGRELVAERFNGGPGLDSPVNIKSASKSVISALVGIAISRGLLDGPDQRIATVLGSDFPAGGDPRLGQITIGHLLSMQAGLQPTSGVNYGRWVSSPNWVRAALARPFEQDPGGPMLYSTGSTHLLSAILTRASGRSTYELAQEWLAGPLGIAIPPWSRDPQGIYFGGNEMRMSPRGLARFGELYRNNGRVGDRQLLPATWVEDSWRSRTVSPWSGNRYGYGWFNARLSGHDVHYGWGYGGQMVYVVPDLRLTVVMTSDPGGARDGGHIDALNAMLSDHIIPAARQGSART